jgi:hypothetical protein
MKFRTFLPPEPFARSPLLVLLPIRGKVGRLESLASSLYGRYEHVLRLSREVDTGVEQETIKRWSAEESMLRLVLEWLQFEPNNLLEAIADESIDEEV